MLVLHLWWSGRVDDNVRLVVGTIVVAERCLRVLLRVVLREDAVVYWRVMVWGVCGGGLFPCVVDGFWWS